MTQLPEPFDSLDPRLPRLLRHAETNYEAASELLKIAAEYLSEQKPMHPDLYNYLANAFLRVANLPPPENENREDRAKQHAAAQAGELTRCLNLTRPPHHPGVDVDIYDARHIIMFNPDKKPADWKKQLRKKTGIGRDKADELVKAAIESLKNYPAK
jgi:hypothetical protein